jgi:uncharacterized membrane protein YphA (DoxX/SURF4 family)
MTSSHADSVSVTRRRTGMALIIVAGLLLLGSGTAKLLGAPPIVHQLQQYGFDRTVWLVGGLEVVSGISLLIPRMRSVGLVMVSAFLGGAIATHVQHHERFAFLLPAVLVLTMTWSGIWLESPASTWSFR